MASGSSWPRWAASAAMVATVAFGLVVARWRAVSFPEADDLAADLQRLRAEPNPVERAAAAQRLLSLVSLVRDEAEELRAEALLADLFDVAAADGGAALLLPLMRTHLDPVWKQDRCAQLERVLSTTLEATQALWHDADLEAHVHACEDVAFREHSAKSLLSRSGFRCHADAECGPRQVCSCPSSACNGPRDCDNDNFCTSTLTAGDMGIPTPCDGGWCIDRPDGALGPFPSRDEAFQARIAELEARRGYR